jgi:hypothetical protein
MHYLSVNHILGSRNYFLRWIRVYSDESHSLQIYAKIQVWYKDEYSREMMN